MHWFSRYQCDCKLSSMSYRGSWTNHALRLSVTVADIAEQVAGVNTFISDPFEKMWPGTGEPGLTINSLRCWITPAKRKRLARQKLQSPRSIGVVAFFFNHRFRKNVRGVRFFGVCPNIGEQNKFYSTAERGRSFGNHQRNWHRKFIGKVGKDFSTITRVAAASHCQRFQD